MKKNYCLFLAVAFCAVVLGCKKGIDYSVNENWVYLENEESYKNADVFFICPTVYGGTQNSFNMSLSDEKTKASFLGATNMEKGIYDDNARFFAPFYRQAGLNVYTLEAEKREKYLKIAYQDVKAAFEFYIKHYNNDNPIVLAGFSQGADMCIRLMKEYFCKEEYKNRLVACYAIGWTYSEDEQKANPHIYFAKDEIDTGVIIAFNSEAENITGSTIIPSGTKTLCINPLNWQTDSTLAEKELNLGACFTDYDGNIVKEIPNLTGAYIDSQRGALKVTDVTAQEYPSHLPIFEDGVYHIYDYQFFYRNLEKNVQTRISHYCRGH